MKDHKHQFFSLPVSVIEQLIKKEVLVPVTSGESYRKLKEPALEYCPKSGIVQVVGTDDRLYVNSIKIEEFLRSARASEAKTEQKQPTPLTSVSVLDGDLSSNKSQTKAFNDYMEAMEKSIDYWISSDIAKQQATKEQLLSYFAHKWQSDNGYLTELSELTATGYEVACLFQNASTTMTPEDYVKIMAILSPVLKEQVVFSVNKKDVSVELAGMVIKIDTDHRLRNALVKEIALKKEVAEKQKAFRQKHSGAAKQVNAASANNAFLVDSIEQNLGDQKPEAYYIRKDDHYGLINYVLVAKFEQGGNLPLAFSVRHSDLVQVRTALEEKLFG